MSHISALIREQYRNKVRQLLFCNLRVNCPPEKGEIPEAPRRLTPVSVFTRYLPGNIGPRNISLVHVCMVSLRKAKSQRCHWHQYRPCFWLQPVSQLGGVFRREFGGPEVVHYTVYPRARGYTGWFWTSNPAPPLGWNLWLTKFNKSTTAALLQFLTGRYIFYNCSRSTIFCIVRKSFSIYWNLFSDRG